MFKFLRKYNKFILAVGGTLLLIVFLIPQAIQQLSQQAALSSANVATVGHTSEELSITAWNEVEIEAQVVQALGLQFPPLGTISDAGHWYLLTREAEQLGFVPPRPTGQFLPTEQDLELLVANVRVSEGMLLRTLAKAQGVSRLVGTFVQSAQASDRRLQHYAQQLFHAVGIETVVIRAEADAVDLTPTEAQLEAQLDAYRDKMPGEGDHGFGYMLPNRVKLEWLTVSADAVRETIRSSEQFSGRELRRHWRENAGQRGLPPVEMGAAVPDIVREDLLEQLTNEQLDLIEKYAYDVIRVPQRNLVTSGGFYVLPDDWDQQRVELRDLAQQMAERFEIAEPTYHGPDDQWLAVDELNSLEGIGSATTEKFGRLASTLQTIIALAKEFDGNGTIPIQVGIAGPPLREIGDNIYVFRMVDAEASRPPTSVDEVRDQLVNDLRRQAHYEQLVAQMSSMEAEAKQAGLLALAMQYDAEVASDDRAALYEPDKYLIERMQQQPLGAMPSQVPGLGDAEDVLERIIEWARSFPPDADLSTMPVEQRIRAFPVDEQFAVVIVKLNAQYPVTVEDYRDLLKNSQLEGLLLTEEFNDVEAVIEAFSFETLSARHNFAYTREPVTEDDEDAPADDAASDEV